MKKLSNIVLILVIASGLVLSLSGCQSGGIAAGATTPASPTAQSSNRSAYSGLTVSGELPDGWQKTTLTELESLLNQNLPIPTYLPASYQIKEVYYIQSPDNLQNADILLLISDQLVQWAGNQYTCPLALELKWNGPGLGLKMPWAEYIPAVRGRLETKGSEYHLWWQTYGSQPLGSTFILYASQQFSKDEMIKIAASIPAPTVTPVTPTVTPENPVLNTIPVNQNVTVNGITLTLEQVVITTTGFNIHVLYTPTGYDATTRMPSSIPGAFAEYSLDGGPTQELVSPPPFIPTSKVIEWSWISDEPLPQSAKELTIRINSVGKQPGPWEFKVPLN